MKQNYGFVQDNNANACSNTASTDTINEYTEIRDRPLFDDGFLRRIPNLSKVPQCVLDMIKEFPDRFPDDRADKVPGEWHLSVDSEYKDGPVSFGSRPIPAAMRGRTKEQREYLEKQVLLAKVPTGIPTPWCSQMHVVHKKDGKSVRVCIDPKFLNKALMREYHPIRTLEDIPGRYPYPGSRFKVLHRPGCHCGVLPATIGY